MRKTETPVERASLELLARHLAAAAGGPRLVEDRVFDKPDGLFRTEVLTFACECTQIPPSYIYRHFAGKDKNDPRESGAIKSTCWPLEPHIWIRDAIAAKSQLAQSYKSSTNADEVWLLIHTPPKSGRDFVDLDKEWIRRAISFGASARTHSFDRIYYASFPSDIKQVLPGKHEATSIEETGVDFTLGYPCLHSDMGIVNFSTTRSAAAKPNSILVEHSQRKTVIVRPKCPVYSKFKPAIRQPVFRFRVKTTDRDARLQMFINWHDSAHPSHWIPQKVQHIAPLQPATAYKFAYLLIHDTH